jgi:hypothetical protein
MPSPPTLFDDEPADRPTIDEASTERRRPNYLARRAAVVGAVVAAVAVVAIVVGRLIGGSDGDPTTGAASSEWNRIVVVDERSGDTVLLDEQGTEERQFDSVPNANDRAIVDATMVVAGDDATSVIDLDNGEADPYEFAGDDIVVPSGTTLTMIVASLDGARALLVHGPSGERIDTADAEVTGARYDVGRAISSPSGRHVLVTDTGNFQTLLLSFDRDEPSYFPGLALAVDDQTVVTAQNVGANATINVFDHDGQLLASGQTPSVRAAMLAGDVVQLVTADGVVAAMSTSSGDLDEGIRLGVRPVESGTVLPGGDRLVVVGANGTQIVGDDGESVAVVEGAVPFPDGTFLRGSTCITLAGALTDESDGNESDGNESDGDAPVADSIVLVDSLAGRVGNSVDGMPAAIDQAADGCTLLLPSEDGYSVVTIDEVVERSEGDPVAIAPDGSAAVVDLDGDLLLVTLADDPDADEPPEPIDLGTSSNRLVYFTQS